MSELVEQVARAILECMNQAPVPDEEWRKVMAGDANDVATMMSWGRAALSVLEPRIEALEAENFKLASGACNVEGGLLGDDHGHVYCSLKARIEALEREQAEGWQDIATAPKDGTPILLFARCKTATAPVILVGWHLPNEGWIESSFTGPVGVVPTHWRPLPPRPGERG